MQSKWLVRSATSIALVAIMAVETVCPVPAHAGVPGLFATEYTQILNYVELAGQLEKQVVMVENQLNQLADMAKHGITITDQLFGTVASDITTLRQIVNTGQALSYTLSNMDGTFRLRFPGYSPSTNYGQSYQTWSQTSLDSTLGALKAAGVQNSQFDSDSALLQSLKSQSQSAVGRMQAIEVGNQIAENQAEQLMKLRQLMMADMQSKSAYQSAMVQADATKQANSDQFFGQTQVTSDGVTFEERTMKWISVFGIGVVLMLAGCKTAEKSQILTAFQNAGGGDVAQATPQGISSFLAQHEDLRKQLTPLCNAQKAKAPADWSTSDEGRICSANERANFFGKPQLKSDGVKF